MALKSVPCCSDVNMPRTKCTFTSASGAQYQLLAGGELRLAVQVRSCALMVAAGMKSIKATDTSKSFMMFISEAVGGPGKLFRGGRIYFGDGDFAGEAFVVVVLDVDAVVHVPTGKVQSLVGDGEIGKNERVGDRSAPRFKNRESLLALRFNDAFNFDNAKCVGINPNAAYKKARFHVLRVRSGGRSNVDDERRSRVDQLSD